MIVCLRTNAPDVRSEKQHQVIQQERRTSDAKGGQGNLDASPLVGHKVVVNVLRVSVDVHGGG